MEYLNKELSEIAEELSDGDWIEKKDQSLSGILLIQTGNVGVIEYRNKEDRKYITEETFRRLDCKEIFPGDILISRLPDPVGRSCIIPELKSRLITAVDCAIFRPKSQYDSKYLNYLLNSYGSMSQVNKFLTGSSRKRISRRNLEKVNLPIPFKNSQPDFEEQKKVADKIDRLFSKIEKGIEKTRLTLASAQKLLQSELTKVFEYGLQNSWEEKRFIDHAKIINGYSFKSTDYKSAGIPLIRIGNLENNVVVLDSCQFLPEKFKDSYKKFILKKGDLLIALSGATTGKIGRYVRDDVALLNQRVGKIVPNNCIDIDYVYYFFLSDYSQKQILELSKGAAQPNLTDKTTQSLKIRIPLKNNQPDTEEQRRVVKRFKNIQDATSELERRCQDQLDDFNKLKQSILNQAFRGKL